MSFMKVLIAHQIFHHIRFSLVIHLPLFSIVVTISQTLLCNNKNVNSPSNPGWWKYHKN